MNTRLICNRHSTAKSAPIGAWEVKLEIMTDRPKKLTDSRVMEKLVSLPIISKIIDVGILYMVSLIPCPISRHFFTDRCHDIRDKLSRIFAIGSETSL